MLRSLLRASMVIALTVACFANGKSPSDVGIGLDKLKWAMTVAQVKAVYPFFKEDTRGSLVVPSYSYGGCDFIVETEFTDGKLDTITFEEVLAPCYSRVLAELLAQFGKPDPTDSLDDGTRRVWKSKRSLVWFRGTEKSILSITFSQAEGWPHHVFVD